MAKWKLLPGIGVLFVLYGATASAMEKPCCTTEVTRILGLARPLKDLSTAKLAVAFDSKTTSDGVTMQPAFIADPWVGVLPVLLAYNNCPSKNAVVLLHGHDSSPDDMQKWIGNYLAKRGFLTVAVQFRSMNVGIEESENAFAFADYGFTLMGLRVYETLLAVKFLKAAGAEKIFIVGHSGGSSTGMLARQVSDDITGTVADLFINFYDHHKYFHCQNVPALKPFADRIQADNPSSLLVIPYNSLSRNQERILSFIGGSGDAAGCWSPYDTALFYSEGDTSAYARNSRNECALHYQGLSDFVTKISSTSAVRLAEEFEGSAFLNFLAAHRLFNGELLEKSRRFLMRTGKLLPKNSRLSLRRKYDTLLRNMQIVDEQQSLRQQNPPGKI